MKRDDSSAAGDAGWFQTTWWSAILLSAQSQAPGLRATLADWCKLYWYPHYASVRRRGYNADEEIHALCEGLVVAKRRLDP